MEPQNPKDGEPKFRVLSVEDNAQYQELLELYFQDDSIQIDMAMDGKDALDLLSGTTYSAVLVDLQLPKVSGQELIREIRHKYGSVPVIVISATDSYGDILSSFESGADYFVTKPYDRDYIRVLLHRALKDTDFFKSHWDRIREKWLKGVPKHRLLTEKNIVEEVDVFLHTKPFSSALYHRIGLLLDRPDRTYKESLSHAADKRPEYLAALLATVPDSGGYAEQAQGLDELNHDFRREMAARLQPLLNTHVRAMPHDTYEEKKALARWVNDELRRFDLAIKCPKTGKPALLVGDPGNHPEIGRFCIEIKAEDGKRKRTVNTPGLPHIELMEAAPRREALSEWHDRVSRQRGGIQRG